MILRLAFLSNNQIEEAYEAYNKAISLEPSNEGYKQNLKIVEEKLKNLHQTGATGPVIIHLTKFLSCKAYSIVLGSW